MEISVEDIQKRFGELPEDLQWAIMAAKIDDHIMEVGNRHALNVAQMGQLSLETHAVALGFTHPDKFQESVQKSLQMPEGKTTSVINDVNETILKTIRKELMAYHTAKKSALASVGSVDEHEIMKSAGIEINPGIYKGTEEPKELPPGHREDMLKKIENPGLITPGSLHPLAEEKFTGSFQMPKKETEYREITRQAPPKTTQTPTPGKQSPDPYREIPG